MPARLQMVSEMDAMVAALMFVANLIALVAFSVGAVYAVALAAMALSEKFQLVKTSKLPKLQITQAKPSATRTVLQ